MSETSIGDAAGHAKPDKWHLVSRLDLQGNVHYIQSVPNTKTAVLHLLQSHI